MFNRINERIERKFWSLAVVLVFICFIFTFSSAVYGYENDNRGENKTQIFENNYLQYKAIAQVVFTNQNEINPYLISSTSFFGCERIMDVSIKRNMDLSLQNTENYFQQKSFSERQNISNENQNNSGTKGWKKALVVAGELTSSFFLGHTIVYTSYALLDVYNYEGECPYLFSYLIGESLGATGGTLGIGKLCHENGPLKGTIIGSLVGTAIGFSGFFLIGGGEGLYSDGGPSYEIGIGTIIVAIAAFAPSVGSVIGYNKK